MHSAIFFQILEHLPLPQNFTSKGAKQRGFTKCQSRIHYHSNLAPLLAFLQSFSEPYAKHHPTITSIFSAIHMKSPGSKMLHFKARIENIFHFWTGDVYIKLQILHCSNLQKKKQQQPQPQQPQPPNLDAKPVGIPHRHRIKAEMDRIPTQTDLWFGAKIAKVAINWKGRGARFQVVKQPDQLDVFRKKNKGENSKTCCWCLGGFLFSNGCFIQKESTSDHVLTQLPWLWVC